MRDGWRETVMAMTEAPLRPPSSSTVEISRNHTATVSVHTSSPPWKGGTRREESEGERDTRRLRRNSVTTLAVARVAPPPPKPRRHRFIAGALGGCWCYQVHTTSDPCSSTF
ncbi:hypothetical protein PIB30_072743 [Stylosanthes scabra]|uniref:Uncharacterized protein n=1 Tax=Stylosanthes scabra TaxID=79078 RepID=A0ABU6ZMV1_9FABA|nr:hypothetical protein [Stylosanthes scabra]